VDGAKIDMKVRWPNFAIKLLRLNDSITQGDFLTVEEAAAYLRLNFKTLYRLAKQGKIPVTRVGREWRFSRAALENYVRRHASVSQTSSRCAPDETSMS